MARPRHRPGPPGGRRGSRPGRRRRRRRHAQRGRQRRDGCRDARRRRSSPTSRCSGGDADRPHRRRHGGRLRPLGRPAGDPRGAGRTRSPTAATRAVDVMRAEVDGPGGERLVRYFVNILSAGPGGLVARYVHRVPRALGGRAGYYLASLVALARTPRAELRVRVTPPRRRLTDDAAAEVVERTLSTYLLAVCNGRVFGGGYLIAPMAAVDDGRLEVVSAGTRDKRHLVVNMPHVYRGTHLEVAGVEHFACGRIDVELVDEALRDRFLMEIDGEELGRLPLSVEVLPRGDHAARLRGSRPQARRLRVPSVARRAPRRCRRRWRRYDGRVQAPSPAGRAPSGRRADVRPHDPAREGLRRRQGPSSPRRWRRSAITPSSSTRASSPSASRPRSSGSPAPTCRRPRSTSPSWRPIVPRSTPSTRPPWPPAAWTTAAPACGRTTTRLLRRLRARRRRQQHRGGLPHAGLSRGRQIGVGGGGDQGDTYTLSV